MPTPIQTFGTPKPTADGSELLPIVASDGSGGYTDHHLTTQAIADLATGSGDMQKATYDTDDDGIVDEAASLSGSPTTGQVWGFDGTAQGFITPSGSGDMLKSTYDTDDDGIVDEAASLSGSPTAGQIWGFDGTAQGFITPTGGGHTIQDDGTAQPQQPNLNFVGATITDDGPNNATVVSLASGSILRQEATPAADLNALWIKPSTAQIFYYDPFSSTWIEI